MRLLFQPEKSGQGRHIKFISLTLVGFPDTHEGFNEDGSWRWEP